MRRSTTAVVAAIVTLALGCRVDPAREDQLVLPDKAAAQWVRPLIEVVNSDDAAEIEKFVSEAFTDGYQNLYPPQAHRRYLQRVHQEAGQLTLHGSRDFDPVLPATELVAVLHAANPDDWLEARISTDPSEGDRISSIDFVPGPPPAGLPAKTSLSETEAVSKLRNHVDRLVADEAFSGAVLVAKGESILFSRAEGLASRRFGVANRVDTRFNLGSMSKMFTAVVILKLVEEGELRLEDSLDRFLDEGWLPRDLSRRIEIRHLLTHTSGLGSYFTPEFFGESRLRFRRLEDYRSHLWTESLAFEPGEAQHYSNDGFFLLGVVIEAVTGEDFFTYVRRRLYEPLGMDSTECYAMDEPIENLAIGYHPDPESPSGWKNNLYQHTLMGGPAGGGFSTVGDLHAFALALTGCEILDCETTESALSPKDELMSPQYGFGFSVDDSRGERIVGHTGGFPGISASLDVFLERGYVVAVLSNHTGQATAVQVKARQLLTRIDD